MYLAGTDTLRLSFSDKACDIWCFQVRFEMLGDLCFLAILCNSTAIEIYDDIIQVSQRFRGCQMLEYIAAIATGDQRTMDDDITNILRTLIFTTLLEIPVMPRDELQATEFSKTLGPYVKACQLLPVCSIPLVAVCCDLTGQK